MEEQHEHSQGNKAHLVLLMQAGYPWHKAAAVNVMLKNVEKDPSPGSDPPGVYACFGPIDSPELTVASTAIEKLAGRSLVFVAS
jgi:hypothetical protein